MHDYLRMSRIPARIVLAVAAAVTLAGCRDGLVAPTTPASSPSTVVAVQHETHTGPLLGNPMFSIRLDVSGEPRAGSSVTVSVTATALVSSEMAELLVLTPEMEVAAITGWDDGFEIPVARRLPARLRWAGPLRAGETIRRSFVLPVPRNGYYSITALIRHASERPTPLLGGHLPQTTAEQVKWLFVNRQSGRVLDQFDPSQVAAGHLVTPGPLRAVGQAGRRPTGKRDPTVQIQSGTVTWQFLYFDSEASQYRPIHSALYDVEYRTGLLGEVTGTDQGYTSLDGYVVMDCRGGERYYGSTSLWGVYVHMTGAFGFDGQFDQHCGTLRQSVLTGNLPRVYAIASDVAREAVLQFGFGRAAVAAEVTTGSGGYYTPGQDKITLGSSAIAGAFGRFVIGHEYGHAYHHVAMGGLNPDYAVNCSPHYLDLPSSYGCALSEGFADFFGTYFTGALLGNFEANMYRQAGVPNPKTEGAVAATFLDLFDAASETHDTVIWNGSYLPTLVGTCKYLNSGVLLRASGIDHITYCLEQDLDNFATTLYGSERSIPSGWSHSAGQPSSWSKSAARMIWHTNLF